MSFMGKMRLLGLLVLMLAVFGPAQAAEVTQLGARQLTATSANVDLARLHNELCDILASVNQIDHRGEPCRPPCEASAAKQEDQCKDGDTFDLAPSAKLLLKTNDGPRQALLDFVRMAELFCESKAGVLTDPRDLEKCWHEIPSALETLRTDAEDLFAMAAGGEGGGADNASAVARADGERAVAAVAALGQSWGWQQRPKAEAAVTDVDTCGGFGADRSIPKELIGTIHEMAKINTGPKMQRATEYFPDLRQAIDSVVGVLNSPKDPTAAELDSLCKFASAVDARTNGRLASYYTTPANAGNLKQKAQRVHDHREAVCAEHLPANEEGLCAVSPSDYAIAFSDYIRASFSSWNNADLVVKREFPKISAAIATRRLLDANSSIVKSSGKPIRLAMVAANLMAAQLGERDANGGAKEGDTVPDEARSQLSLLLSRLPVPKPDGVPVEAGSCEPLQVSAVLKDATTLGTWLKNQLDLIDKATAIKPDGENPAATADEVRNRLIKEARAWLLEALPDGSLAAIRKAADQLESLSDHLTLGEPSDEGNGLVLAATLQSACARGGKVDIELAFSLLPKTLATTKLGENGAQEDEGHVTGIPFALSLRRSLTVSLDVPAFQSNLLAGTLESTLTAVAEKNLPADFAIDLGELCSLSATLDAAKGADSKAANCVWPSALQLPARARVSFASDFASVTVALPDWLKGRLPADCSNEITIGKGADSVKKLTSCLGDKLQSDGLTAMLGERVTTLKRLASEAASALYPEPLKQLIDEGGLTDEGACKPEAKVETTSDYKDLASIKQSVLIRPELDDKGNAVPVPQSVSLLTVTARLAIDDCLKSTGTKLSPRLRGIWAGAALQWSQTYSVTLPTFGLNASGGKGPLDPLDIWTDAIADFAKTGKSTMFVAGDVKGSDVSELDRDIVASALLASGHLELCKTSDGSEELHFYFSSLSATGAMNEAPCAPVVPADGATVVPPLVLATGPTFKSLHAAPEVANSIIGPLTANFASSVALRLADAKLEFGTAPAIPNDARSCGGNVLAANRLSFDIDQGTFGSEAVGALPLLHVLVGWEPGRPASLALVADKPIEQIGKVIATAGHLDPARVKVMGFAATGADVRPCLVEPKPAVLAAKLGAAFAQDLLSPDLADKLGAGAEAVGNVASLVQFIRDKQPWMSTTAQLEQAWSKLLLQLKSCSGKENDRFLTCDYVIALGGCPIRLRIDATHLSLTFKGDDLKLPPGCAPETLGLLFGSDAGGALPFTLAEPVLTISDKVELTAELKATGDTSSAAVNACLAKLDLTQQSIRVSVDSAGAMSLAADPAVKKALTDCAIDYAAGKIVDGFVSAGLDPEALAGRVDQAIQQWIATSNAAMDRTCSAVSGALSCTPVTVAEAARAFPNDWSKAAGEICGLVAAPIDSALQKMGGAAVARCGEVLRGSACSDHPEQSICAAKIGFRFEASFDLPNGQKAKASAHYLPPKAFVTDKCFDAGQQAVDAKYLDILVQPDCKGAVLGLTGTVSLSKDFPLAISGAPVPVSAAISLSVNLVTGSVNANIKGPSWQGILSTALSRAIKGKKVEAAGSTVEVTDASVDASSVVTITGTLMLDYGEHIELPGFRMTLNLKNGDLDVKAPDASAAAGGLFKRLASSISIPGVLSINPDPPVFENNKFKSISAKITVQGGVFEATLPPMIFDSKGVRFGDPFSITLVFKSEIPIPPLTLTNIRGTIGQKFLSLGADATLLQATLAYLVKATGDFTLPFDLHDDITAIEQMIVFTVVPLGKSTTVINIHGPVLSRTIEIGGALKPIIWLFGQATLDGKKITGNTNFAVFGVDLAHSKLDADLGSGQVSASGSADIGIGSLDYAFNGKQFTDNMRLQMNGNIHVGKFNLSSFNTLATPSSAAVKFRVLGISLGFVTPRLKDINSGMLEKMIEKLFSFSLKDLAKALEAILSGNLTINPYSHFGKDDGNGVASGDANGSEGGADGKDGSSEANGGGATGGVPGAASKAAKQTPTGTGNQAAHDQAEAAAKTETENLQKSATEAGSVEGASKPLLNPQGEFVMQFSLKANGADQTIIGNVARPGQESPAPLLVMKQGNEPKTFFSLKAAPRLGVVPTPVLLEHRLFVASEASMAPFLPAEPRNTDASPVRDLCQGKVSEVDLLLFAQDSDAAAPRRLPAGLLGLCLEGLKNLASKPEATDLLLAGLRTAAITLPKWPEEEIKDKASVTGPLKAAWFQCDGPNGKGGITGLSMLIGGELSSRVVLRQPDGLLRNFSMTGFPYGPTEEDAKQRVAACLLLDAADPQQNGKPFDFITLRQDKKVVLTAGRSPSGEFEYDGSDWGPLKADDHNPVPPIVPLIPPLDPKDKAVAEAIKDQNKDRQTKSEGGDKTSQAVYRGGDELCVVDANGVPTLAYREGAAKINFMALRDNSDFSFPIDAPQLTFPSIAAGADADGCSIPKSPAPVVIFDPSTPGVGRLMKSEPLCALDYYWLEGPAGRHTGFKLSQPLCAIARAANTEDLEYIFEHDMFWVISPFMFCMDYDPTHKADCVTGPLNVGGGRSETNRVVVAAAPRSKGINVWAGPIEVGREPGTPLTGDQAALDGFVDREWTPAQVDVFTDWFTRNTAGLRLLQSSAERLDFMAASSVLRINLSGAPLKTEIDFIGVPGLLNDEMIRQALGIDGAIPSGQEKVNVALISNINGTLTFAVQPGTDAGAAWDLWQNGTKLAATLTALSEADLVPGLGLAVGKLAGEAAPISISHNASSLLAANGDAAFVADLQGACVASMFAADLDASIRQALVGLWIKDFGQSPLKIKAPCSEPAVAIAPHKAKPDAEEFTVVDYPPLVLGRFSVSHVLASGRTVTVVRRAEITKDFRAAEERAMQFALNHPELGDHLQILGEIGNDKIRFAFTKDAGLAGPKFACPFDDAEVFSHASMVLNEYLASIDKQCQDGKPISGSDIAFNEIGTSFGGVDVVTAPVAEKPGTWSLFFGDGDGPATGIQSAIVSLPPNDNAGLRASVLEGLVRSWARMSTTVGRGSSFALKRYPSPDCVDCLAIVIGGNPPRIVASATSGAAANQFWPIGDTTTADPFAGLDEPTAEIASTILRSDLERISGAGGTSAKSDTPFCTVKEGSTLLWPNLTAKGEKPYAQLYHGIVSGKEASQVKVVSDVPPTCDRLQSTLGTAFDSDLRVVELVQRPNIAKPEVWLADEPGTTRPTYSRQGDACDVKSAVVDLDTFSALTRRPPTLDCPDQITKRVMGPGSGVLPRLVLTKDKTAYGSLAWVDGPEGFRAIGLVDSDVDYSERHWRLIEPGDLALDAENVSLAVALGTSEAPALAVVRTDGQIVVRQRGKDPKTVQTLGFPSSASNRAVLAALRQWINSEADPQGLVFPTEDRVTFWMVNDLQHVTLFEQKPDSMWIYPVSVGAGNFDLNALMTILHDADQRILDAIEERSDDEFVATLRVSSSSLSIVGQHRLVFQTGVKEHHVQSIAFGPETSRSSTLTDDLVAALSGEPSLCADASCSLFVHEARFALRDGNAVVFGGGNDGQLGHATVVEADGVDTAGLIGRLLEAADRSQLSPEDGLIVEMGHEQGVLIDSKARTALFVDSTQSRSLAMRPALAALASAELAAKFAGREADFVDRLAKLAGSPSIGMVNGLDAFACTDSSLVIFDGPRTGTVTGIDGIEPFCAAVETSIFHTDGDADLSLIQHGQDFLLFKPIADSRFRVRIWRAGTERKLDLPFSPTGLPKPSLRSDILDAALGCASVEQIATEGSGLALMGQPAAWSCTVTLTGQDPAPLSGPILFTELTGPGGATAIATVTIPQGPPRTGTSKVLATLATHVLANCNDKPVVAAGSREATTIIATEACVGVTSWLPALNGPVQTITGEAAQVRSLWAVLGTAINGLAGTELHLDVFIDGKGAVVSEGGTLTIAPLKEQPVSHATAAIETARDAVCDSNAIGAKCKQVLASDIAKAALRAKGLPGGRRIPFAGDPGGLIWPNNVWDFWISIPN